MNLQDRLVSALDRIASGTGVARVRRADEARAARHNGVVADLDDRLEEAVVQLEAAADALWSAIKV